MLQKWGFSAITLTAVFAVYAMALLIAFLVAGRLSDHVGRKPVIIAALVDLAPSHNPRLAPLVNSAAPTMGLATGALGSSLLVTYGPAPMRLVYWILLGLIVAGLAGILMVSEPGQHRPGVLASLRPQAGVPCEVQRAFVAGLPALIAGWALGGFYLALGPSLAATLLHSASAVPGGVVIFLLAGVGAAATIAGRTSQPATSIAYGALVALLAAVVAAETARSARHPQPATAVASEVPLPSGPCCPPGAPQPAWHAAREEEGVALASGTDP